ncbi:MAG TPA: Rne/Rng family ribonuclease [Actinomycetota bacterium]|jgi:ribonuclease E|nr:Rne/Rng family ribonuclease [Actinomycetota bacterium]
MTDAPTPEQIGVREEDQDTSSSAASKDGTSDSAETTTPPRRRRSRGGRGRSSSSRSRAAAGNEATETTAEPATVEERGGDEVPEIDLDAQPGETERVDATIEISADGQVTSEGVRRRRRRGGRGRRGRGRAVAQADSDAADGTEPVDVVANEAEGADLEVETVGVAEESPAGAAAPRRRRRRGGRGRRRSSQAAALTGSEGSADDGDDVPRVATDETGDEATTRTSTPRTRRTRATATTSRTRSRGPRTAAAEAEREDTARRVTQTKEDASSDGRVSTRLSRQRQSRQVRRRRDVPPTIKPVTDKVMVVTEHGDRDQIAVLEGPDLVQHYVTRAGTRSMVGNVYLGRVQNVLPGMEAAFVDVGRGRNAVLYAGEVNWSPEDLDGAPRRIEHALKSGQSIMVQVTKDPIGGKGARLTAQISLPGRYLVLAPNSDVTGVSRRLGVTERNRLKAIYRRIKPDQHGLIVRTAAASATEEALTADLERLLNEWASIEKAAKRAKAPAVLYEEPELTLRVVRDLFTDEEYRELATDSKRLYEQIVGYLAGIAPDLLPKVRLHQGSLPVFEEYRIVEQILKGLDRKVWLPSGGYIVIDRTEALTVIDVNTGKSVGKTNLEETVVNTNVEAAREIARQLRLRDIGGMIVIDFIDMLLEQNKKKVIGAMKEALAQDKSRSQVFDISPLGLLEVTRKRVSGGLLESFSETCPTCEGRGLILKYDVD